MNSKKQHSCIILCGGQSRRMGQDKGSMIIQDKPMINHILSTLNNEINEVMDLSSNYQKYLNQIINSLFLKKSLNFSYIY